MGTLSCGPSSPIYRHLVCRFFIKTLISISISTNIHRPYDGELFQNMNTRVPNEPILLLTHEFEKLSIH